jgi:hypothetical protein
LEEKPKPKTMQEWSESITEEDIENAKKSGINLNKLTKYLVGATTVIGKGVKSAPIVGDVISGTQEAIKARREGDPTSTAVTKGLMEALPVSPSMIRDVEGLGKKSAETMVEKSMESEGQNVGFLEGLTRSFTGTPLGGFSSGGFISKNQSGRQ